MNRTPLVLRAIVPTTVIVAVHCGGCNAVAVENKIPDDVVAVFEKAKSIELYSINFWVDAGEEKINGVKPGGKILGKTVLKGDEGQKLFAALKESAASNKEAESKCYDPRHVLVATTEDGKTATVEICFRCNSAYARTEQNKVVHFLPGRATNNAFNKSLTDAKIPIAGAEAKN